jgi:hypothetical protein
MLITTTIALAVLAAGRTDPLAVYAAEADVVLVKVQVPGADYVVWNDVTLRVKRCVAGTCARYDMVNVRVPASQWHHKQGDHMGIVRYAWQDDLGFERSWSVALSLDDDDEKQRFQYECEVAVAGGETPISGTAVGMMKKLTPEPASSGRAIAAR